MKDKTLQLLRMFGVNRAIGYGVLTRTWGALAGPVTILLIATRFTKIEQGYYYTFSSLLALQIFFELGLLTVMAQFASHEFAHLSWGKKGTVQGDCKHQERFYDLLYKGVKWYAISAVTLTGVLIPAGLYFFSTQQQSEVNFSWQLPWALAVIGVAGNLLIIPFNAVITGSGDVAFTNRQQMLGGITGSLVSWLIITLGGGLYAIPAVSSGTIAIGALYILRGKPRLVISVWERLTHKVEDNHHISWWREVWPMQWKIALSWISGYFIFQLMTPVLFKYHGAVVAGQMGMTLSATNALLGICLTWINARSPEFGKLIAVRDWPELDKLFSKTLTQSTTIAGLGALLGWIIVLIIQANFQIGQRFLPSYQVAILLASTVPSVMTYGYATYLRAHRQEPLLVVSMLVGIVQGTLTWLLGKLYTSHGVTISFLAVNLCFALPAVYLVWKRLRKEWHPIEAT